MKLNLKLNRAIAGYILAGVAMLLIVLYLRFPGEAVTDYVKSTVTAGYPDTLLSIDAILPSFPPGLAIENVTVGFRDRPEATLHADGLTVRPGGLPLLRGRLAILMAAEGYGGEARGRIDYTNLFSFQGPLAAEANFRDIRIEKCAWLKGVMSRQITGTLKGALTFGGTAGALKNGTGNLDFTLTSGTYQLLENFFGFEKLEFSKVDGKVSYRNGALRITQLTLTGEKIRLSLKGNILLADPMQDSQIDMTGAFEIPVQNSKRVTMEISGTLGNPKTRFN
jgi:type II secretion system protein N